MKSRKTIMILFLSSILLCACSSDNEKESKPGKIDTMTKEVSQEAVRMIKTPIEKARAVAEKEEDHNQELKEINKQ